MILVKVGYNRWRGRLCLAKLLKKACEQVVKFLVILPPKVTINIRDANIRVLTEFGNNILDDDRSKNCLSRSRNSRIEERLLIRLKPISER